MSDQEDSPKGDEEWQAVDALVSIWKGGYKISHMWWCVSTHGTGKPCDCGLGELKAIIQEELGGRDAR